ncbi:MAG: hypothetical protein HPZ91_19995 [Lentisphaeria bacterium]|nr:hypothetical protein [Lentisphaeria bacterium]
MNWKRIGNCMKRHPAGTGSLAAAVAVMMMWGAWSGYCSVRFHSTVRELERGGIPCSIAALEARQQGGSEKQQKEFMAVCEAVSASASTELDVRSSMAHVELKDFPKFQADHAETIRNADRFLEERPDFVLWRDFSVGNVWDVMLPDLNHLRTWMRMNRDRFYYALQQKEPGEAVRIFDLSATLRRYAVRDQFLISYLVAIAVESIRQGAVFDAAFDGDIGQFDSKTLKRWADSMPGVEAEFRTRLPGVLETEIVTVVTVASRVDAVLADLLDMPKPLAGVFGIIYAPVVKLDSAAAARALKDVLPAATLDYTPETILKLQPFRDFVAARQKIILLAPVSNFLLPALTHPINRASTMHARCRVVRTGLAVELFLRKYNRLPSALDELVPEFLPEVPRSPFTGKPLQLETGKLQYWQRMEERAGEFEGYRVYAEGDPAYPPVGATRTDRRGTVLPWNRTLKK